MSRDAALESLVADAMTPDYLPAHSHKRTTWTVRLVSIGASALLATLVAQAVGQTQALKTERATTRSALLNRVDVADRRIAALESQVGKAQVDLQIAENAVLSGTPLGGTTASLVSRLRAATGYTPVTGSGVEVLLADSTLGNTEGRVLDRDIQQVVNGLWATGATAISVNDRRITATTAIRSAGAAILVDYRPLVPPYRVTAIAQNADSLAGRFRESAAGLFLEDLGTRYGVVWEINTLGPTTIPAAQGGTS